MLYINIINKVRVYILIVSNCFFLQCYYHKIGGDNIDNIDNSDNIDNNSVLCFDAIESDDEGESTNQMSLPKGSNFVWEFGLVRSRNVGAQSHVS